MTDELIDYATWGERFFTSAVTVDRVLLGVNVLAGRPIDVGPMGVGPGRIAKVTARGQIGTATGQRAGGAPVTFHIVLPVALEFVIDLGMDKQRFDADITLPLVITAHARGDLAIALEVTPPEPAEVVVRLKAQGLRASLTQRAAGVEGELRRFVARYVAKELAKPYVRDATLIDVAAAVDRAASQLGPRAETTSPIAEELTGDLPAAMEAELEHAAELFLAPPPDADRDHDEGQIP